MLMTMTMMIRMRTLLDSSASNLSLHCKGALSWNYQVGHDDDDIDIFDDDEETMVNLMKMLTTSPLYGYPLLKLPSRPHDDYADYKHARGISIRWNPPLYHLNHTSDTPVTGLALSPYNQLMTIHPVKIAVINTQDLLVSIRWSLSPLSHLILL